MTTRPNIKSDRTRGGSPKPKLKQFKKCDIEITSVCNLACSFCPPTLRARQFVSPENFAERLDQITPNTKYIHIQVKSAPLLHQQIGKPENFAERLDQIKPHTKYIHLHVKGEPLLHPQIDTLLDIAHEKDFYVHITTNGTLIEKRKEQLVDKPAIRQMNFSLHSFDDNIGLKDKDTYMKNILNFVKDQVPKTNMYVSFRLWNLSKDNQTNLEKRRNRELLSIIEEAFNLDFQIEERVEPGGGIQVADRIYVNQDHLFEWPSLDAEEDDGRGFCYGLRNQAAILSNGTVRSEERRVGNEC